MKIRKLLAGTALATVLAAKAMAAEGPVSVNVVFDNTATLLNVADAQEVAKLLLHQLGKYRKRSETKHATISLVSLNDPRNLYVGTPKTMKRSAASVLQLLGVVVNGCHDMVGAMEQVRTNVQQQKAERVELYIVSSMIHTGAPCADATVALPHPAPENLDLKFLKDRKAKVRGYWVHHLQMRTMLDAFTKAGLGDFRLYDEATSKSVLLEGLE